MLEIDFKGYELNSFTPAQIKATGAELGAVQLELLIRAQKFCTLARRGIVFIKDGLTTGDHRNPLHFKGLAMDFILDPKDGPIKILDIFKASLDAGFRGIGVYWDGKNYQFHLDLRSNLAFWSGTKLPTKDWDYHSLILDPKSIK